MKGFYMLVTILICLISSIHSQTQTFSNPGNYSYTVPTGMNTIKVQVWGAGGGSTGGSGGARNGAGGGGYTEKIITVTAGEMFNLYVGAGGTANAARGDSSTFSTTLLIAYGGGRGTASGAGAGGTATGGSTNVSGGNGGLRIQNVAGGGGGGSGIGATNGGNAMIITTSMPPDTLGGIAGSPSGGAGQTIRGGAANAGSSPGGGAGGLGDGGSGTGGVGGNGQIVITASFVMPIELIFFDVEPLEKITSISWSTASESNNDYFTIERSADGNHFISIGTVKGAGNSSQTLDYSYADGSPLSGTSYYRLKQTDFDGQYSYSDVRMVQFKQGNGARVWYNMANNVLMSEWSEATYDVQIMDMTGKLVKNMTSIYSSGQTNLDDLNNGTYVVILKSGSAQQVIRFVKN